MILPSFDCRITTPHGDDIADVFSALEQKKSAATVLPQCLSPGIHNSTLVPIQLGIVPTLANTPKPTDRILALLKNSLVPLIQQLFSLDKINKNIVRLLIIIILPSKNSVRYAHCTEQMIETFVKTMPGLEAIPTDVMHFIHEDDDLIDAFIQGQKKLKVGTIDRLIFGGVDSFLTPKAIRSFETQQSIRKEGNPDAPLLGEGAAFVCLSNQAPLLANAIETDNTLSKMPDSSYWVTNRSVRLRAEFEWYETIKKYPKLSHIKEVNLQKWLGHLGAAQFPTQIALGFYWASTRKNSTTEPIVLYNQGLQKQLILQAYERLQNDAALYPI
jgi:hypothetical protein